MSCWMRLRWTMRLSLLAAWCSCVVGRKLKVRSGFQFRLPRAGRVFLSEKNLERWLQTRISEVAPSSTRGFDMLKASPSSSQEPARRRRIDLCKHALSTMILDIFTAAFVVAVGALGLSCLALGLHSLSHYIETHAVRARVLGLRALIFTAAVQVLVVVLDDVPLSPLLPSLAAVWLHYRAISRPGWPFATTGSTVSRTGTLEALLSLVLLPLCSHIWLMCSHTLSLHAWHKHRYDTLHRPKLPGGRLDWDVDSTEPPSAREMTDRKSVV